LKLFANISQNESGNTTLRTLAFSITALIITSFSIKCIFATLSINEAESKWHSASQRSVSSDIILCVSLCWVPRLIYCYKECNYTGCRNADIMGPIDRFAREPLLKVTAQYSWPPWTNYLRSAAFLLQTLFTFLQNKLPNEEANYSEPSLHLVFPDLA
jgi:hypothetical protein